MKLFIVRHAWAGEHGDPHYPDDSLRPLTHDGRRRFQAVVAALHPRGFAPEIIASSPLVRCRQTAEIIAGHTGQPKIEILDALAPGSDLLELIAWTQQQRVDTSAWVGHAPDVSRLTSALIGDEHAQLRFAKGTIAALGFPEKIHTGSGELLWLATAKILGV